MSETWRVNRASIEWVGGFVVTATKNNGVPIVINPANLKIAYLPRGTQPTGELDPAWQALTVEPGGTRYGYMTPVVSTYIDGGFWIWVTDTPEKPIREPDQVGWLVRT